MAPLLTLLLSLSGDAVGGAVSRGTKSLGFLVVAAAFLFTAYLAGIGALAVYLAEHMSLWAALAVVSGSLIVAAAAVLLAGSWHAQAGARRSQQLASSTQDAALKALSDFASEGSARSLLVAAVAGLVAGGLLDAKRRRS